MVAIYAYMLRQVGPTFLLLFPMSVVALSFLIVLGLGKLLGLHSPHFVQSYLLYARSTSVQVGLLGSVLGLCMGMSHTDLGGGKEALETVLHLLGNCFFSTVYGILISLACSVGCWERQER